MFYLLLFRLCTFMFLFQAGTPSLPSFLAPCKGPEASECWRQNIEKTRPYLIDGINALQIPSIDPIYISKLSVRRTNTGSATYDMQYKDIVLTGTRNFELLESYIDPLSLVIKLKLGFPNLIWTSNGRAKGNAFGFPINGTFGLDIIFTNLVLDLTLDGEEYASQGSNYIHWSRGSIEVSYESAHLTASAALKASVLQSLNEALNQKTEIVKPHVTPLITNTLGTFVIKLLNRFHGTFSRDELFPK